MTIGSTQTPYRCFAKLFVTWSRYERLLRLGRIVWRRGMPGSSGGYSAMLSLALTPRLFKWRKEVFGMTLILLGIRLHYQRSYGGWFT